LHTSTTKYRYYQCPEKSVISRVPRKHIRDMKLKINAFLNSKLDGGEYVYFMQHLLYHFEWGPDPPRQSSEKENLNVHTII
jgi:hypothetical protein